VTRSARVATVAVVVLSAVASLSGCSGGPDEPATTATTTRSATPKATPTANADEQALRALWDDYWAATVTAFAGPDPDPTLWQGFATGELAQANITLVQQYVDNGVVYTGEPRTVSVDVDIDGDSALLTGCVDMSDWVLHDATGVVTRDKDVYPAAYAARRLDGAWVLTSDSEPVDGVTC
jgi:hypothetical protein